MEEPAVQVGKGMIIASGVHEELDELREIAFNGNGSGDHTNGVKYPNLVEMADGWRYDPIGPEGCNDQGFFYNDETEETDWDEFEDEESEF